MNIIKKSKINKIKIGIISIGIIMSQVMLSSCGQNVVNTSTNNISSNEAPTSVSTAQNSTDNSLTGVVEEKKQDNTIKENNTSANDTNKVVTTNSDQQGNTVSNKDNSTNNQEQIDYSYFGQYQMSDEGFSQYVKDNAIDRDYKIELDKLQNSSSFNTQSWVGIEGKYTDIWDEELNNIYNKLLNKLNEKEKEKLLNAQKGWLQFHISEAEFINETWNDLQLGSQGRVQSIMSVKNRIRERTLQLMEYYYMLGGKVEFLYQGENDAQVQASAKITSSTSDSSANNLSIENLGKISDVFPDHTLAQKIAETLGKDVSDIVSKEELAGIKGEFLVPLNDTADLTGIGYLTGITTLSCYKNNVRRIPAEIGNLVNLEYLNFSKAYVLKTYHQK